jgi:hypothetical protein
MKIGFRYLRNYTIYIVASIAIIFIAIFTWKVIYLTDKPELFGIDFENKNQIIAAYAALVGVVLTFLSIIFVLLTIIRQKEQFDDEKEIEQKKVKDDLFDRLVLIKFVLENIIKHISDTGSKIKEFFLKENEKPLETNLLYFYANKNYYRILDMDYFKTFQSFQTYFNSDDDNKEKYFGDLYKLIDFYSEAFESLKNKYDYHSKDKFEKKLRLKTDLDSLMNIILEMKKKYKKHYTSSYNDSKLHNSITSLFDKYYQILSTQSSEETNLENIFELLRGFIQEIEDATIENRIKDDFDKFFGLFYKIIDTINTIKNDAMFFANDLERMHLNYYTDGCDNIVGIKELESIIETQINKASG